MSRPCYLPFFRFAHSSIPSPQTARTASRRLLSVTLHCPSPSTTPPLPAPLSLPLATRCDIAFAVDSIPAILSLTSSPFLLLTSQALSLLQLRAVYFLLEALATYLDSMQRVVAYRFIPFHTVSYRCIPLHTVTYRYLESMQRVSRRGGGK